jgi:hypothetical protein
VQHSFTQQPQNHMSAVLLVHAAYETLGIGHAWCTRHYVAFGALTYMHC